MLPGKYLSEEMTLATARCIREQDSINFPGFLRSSPSASPHPADFLSVWNSSAHTPQVAELKFPSAPSDWCSFPPTFSGCLIYLYPSLKVISCFLSLVRLTSSVLMVFSLPHPQFFQNHLFLLLRIKRDDIC